MLEAIFRSGPVVAGGAPHRGRRLGLVVRGQARPGNGPYTMSTSIFVRGCARASSRRTTPRTRRPRCGPATTSSPSTAGAGAPRLRLHSRADFSRRVAILTLADPAASWPVGCHMLRAPTVRVCFECCGDRDTRACICIRGTPAACPRQAAGIKRSRWCHVPARRAPPAILCGFAAAPCQQQRKGNKEGA